MKCTVCGKDTSEFSDGYCLRCEKIAGDVDAELGIECEPELVLPRDEETLLRSQKHAFVNGHL